MISSLFRVRLFLVALSFVFIAGCASEERNAQTVTTSSDTGTTAAIDTSSPGKSVEVPAGEHHIYFHPPVGSKQRYRVQMTTDVSMQSTDDLLGTGGQKTQVAKNRTAFILTQIVKGIKADSSIDMTYRVDSISTFTQQDTLKVVYNSGNAANRKDERFQQFNVLLGQEFGAIISRTGEVTEMYGLSPVVKQVMKDLPDSVKTEQNQSVVTRQLEGLLGQYVSRVLLYVPSKPIGVDTMWSSKAETVVPFPLGIQFPVIVTLQTKVTGFEERGGQRVAVVVSNSMTRPQKTELEHGTVKAHLTNFSASSSGKTYTSDETGLLLYRSISEHRGYSFSLESKQQPGKRYSSEQSAAEHTLVEMLR